jgi:septum formation protein
MLGSPRLILASSSPRRRELLTQAGLTFDVLPADIDETRGPNEEPSAYVRRLALEKAQAIHAQHPNATVIGSDTTVVLAGEVLSKPTDLADAERMLRSLSNNVHQVYTGVAVVTDTQALQHVEATSVFFSNIPDEDLAHYLATGDSLDKAGAYGIQGYAARWITRIEGDFFNVMGLPIAATVRLLGQVWVAPPSPPYFR